MKRTLYKSLMALLVAGASILTTSAAVPTNSTADERTAKKVRTELLTMPFLSVFDHLTYRIDGDTVYLHGQVIRPTLKSDAGNRVARIEGITKVVNEIEVLPLSPFDDRVRLAVARAVYGNSVLNRYALNPNPSIRIVVKNGNVTLEGVVAREMDRNVANLAANGVFGVFSVTNNLRIEDSRI